MPMRQGKSINHCKVQFDAQVPKHVVQKQAKGKWQKTQKCLLG